ncbi:MAG: hypothetical protein K0R03_2574 [Moraxellaceae bacterium]|jgi:hypothetical protein|nr:hypothetical protein [Moraxellaceae bacterium]
MNRRFVHYIKATDPASRHRIVALLGELKGIFIRTSTPLGTAISPVISSWRLEQDDVYEVQFTALAAVRLPELSGIELLEAARMLAGAADLQPRTPPSASAA